MITAEKQMAKSPSDPREMQLLPSSLATQSELLSAPPCVGPLETSP